jgi:hypothetical protein
MSLDRLVERLAQIRNRIPQVRGRDAIATRHSLVFPFLEAFGYDIWDPGEVCLNLDTKPHGEPGQQVNIVLKEQGVPLICFDVKAIGTALDAHVEPLARYFKSSKTVSLAVLTDGVEYRFFTDSDKIHQIDKRPFLILHMEDLDLPKDVLKRFHKAFYSPEAIRDFARMHIVQQDENQAVAITYPIPELKPPRCLCVSSEHREILPDLAALLRKEAARVFGEPMRGVWLQPNSFKWRDNRKNKKHPSFPPCNRAYPLDILISRTFRNILLFEENRESFKLCQNGLPVVVPEAPFSYEGDADIRFIQHLKITQEEFKQQYQILLLPVKLNVRFQKQKIEFQLEHVLSTTEWVEGCPNFEVWDDGRSLGLRSDRDEEDRKWLARCAEKVSELKELISSLESVERTENDSRSVEIDADPRKPIRLRLVTSEEMELEDEERDVDSYD